MSPESGEDETKQLRKLVNHANDRLLTLSAQVKDKEETIFLNRISVKLEKLKSLDWRSINLNELKAMTDIRNANSADGSRWYHLLSTERVKTIAFLKSMNDLIDELSVNLQ